MKTTSSSKVIGIERYRAATENQTDSLDITHLALQLQQTIELTPLLQAFCHETARLIPCDSVRYKNENRLLNYQTGETKVHRCRYQLELENELLGEIECTRAKPFSIIETDLMERLLSLLIYPLRNALLYQKAVAEAHRDPLTQISNRAAFDEALDREICSFKRHLTGFSLMVIDIDHFKNINDTYGHIVGDSVLKAVAQKIRNTVRRSDEVFRYGGEEFVVLLSNTELDGAKFIAERIRRAIKQVTINSNKNISVTASVGISSANNLKDVSDTLYHADKALYQAKDEGRDRVVVRP
ncbi:GGDEF domain-containing protein [Aliikangiella coralliicola]|uniref:diguanylate cyclase n=1 Tax=Aliikangiella coralliicola TaxID=2592383 RepID=A0A545UAM5_9GAMM|nr:GGDEF domain-containing protein [Aliikangiella coralliicola]TQV86483.1 GGDEF domain-containing protein [Aliikangiella coralliicola]